MTTAVATHDKSSRTTYLPNSSMRNTFMRFSNVLRGAFRDDDDVDDADDVDDVDDDEDDGRSDCDVDVAALTSSLSLSPLISMPLSDSAATTWPMRAVSDAFSVATTVSVCVRSSSI
jgi:hypothetical protein